MFLWLLFCGHFLRSIALHRVSNVSFRKSFRFFSKTYQICHCEEGIFNARRGNLKRDETASRNEARQILRDVAL